MITNLHKRYQTLFRISEICIIYGFKYCNYCMCPTTHYDVIQDHFDPASENPNLLVYKSGFACYGVRRQYRAHC